MKITIKDSKTLKDSIATTKKKINDLGIDLTQPGIDSIANALLEEKEAINNTTSFEDLRDIMKEAIKKFDTPKSREIKAKIEELNRLYQRDPKRGSRNDYWLWDKLLKYCYNILLKASNLGSPDVEEVKEELGYMMGKHDSCTKDEDEDPTLRLCKLLGEAHDKIMEAQDLAKDLIEANELGQDLEYALEDLEADLSEFDFMGEGDPAAGLREKFLPSNNEDWDLDLDDLD